MSTPEPAPASAARRFAGGAKFFYASTLILTAAAGFGIAVLLQTLQLLPAAGVQDGDRPGPEDIGFAQFMSLHHDQAVTMCEIVLADGTSKVRTIAEAIQMAQLLEMGQMRGWLQAWRQPTVPRTKRMSWLLAGRTPPDAALLRYIAECDASPGGMAGMASADDLNRLRDARGDARDRLFLQLMIRHHAGALPMAQFAAANAHTRLIRQLAQVDLIEQSKELSEMQLMLQHEFGS